MKKCVAWPTTKSRKGKGIGARLKLEEDLHFDNIKFCASGSVELEGTGYAFATVRDFGKYFARIEDWVPGTEPLKPDSDWLCTRRNRSDGSLHESELSFKIKKEKTLQKGKGKKTVRKWDYAALHAANRLYLELQKNPVFEQEPSIFLVNSPAKSTDLKTICKNNRGVC